ncbi:ohanin-like [Hemicordylus capensis]|uniref:ohanin-like n=1 Tax=Hemicordylus capensis TaxID=884348 RepID=UPI00230455C0|nr:ohanin-like [Hemicordylus capensis]
MFMQFHKSILAQLPEIVKMQLCLNITPKIAFVQFLEVGPRVQADLINCATSITFDPNTAHPSLAVSEDRMYVESGGVQDVPDNPERFDSTACLLGSPGFTSGKHYWEVKYENQREWAVGVAKGSVERKGYITLTPEEGIWQEGLWWLRRMDTTSQTLPNQPEKIGVFLDYEHGTVSFYMGSKVIRKKASFDGEKVFPFFYVGRGVWLKLIS